MKKIQFPIFKTKIKGVTRKFNLADPKEYQAYFELKAGREIKKLRNYLKENTFIAYLLGKKNSGKGTYSKIFAEIINPQRIEHFSIGDMVREVDKELKDKKGRKELIEFLEKNYRGRFSIEKLIYLLKIRSTTTPYLPTELILSLVKREIAKRKKKALFIDGFPRGLDQLNFALFFRDLIGYRDDPDLFVLIDVPENIIDARIKHRVICPQCQSPRNLKLHLVAKEKIKYDEKKKKFYFICDNPDCQNQKMFQKEGDKLGIKPIKKRLKKAEKLIEMAFSLYGVPKILLRNSLPVKGAAKFVDKYEITPEYSYQWDKKTKKVRIIEKPWQTPDDEGIPSHSLLPPPMVISMIKQIVGVLHL